jgi:hypothetical protein
MPPQITYSNDKRMHRSHSNEDFSNSSPNSKMALVNRDKKLTNYKNLIFSRYSSDFLEIEKLGQGGFGEVYKVNTFCVFSKSIFLLR